LAAQVWVPEIISGFGNSSQSWPAVIRQFTPFGWLMTRVQVTFGEA
jgi:hypothetical protein